MKKLLSEPVIVFWIGMVFGMSITALMVGDKMIPKAILKMNKIYIDGKYYEIRKLHEITSRN